MGLEAPKPIDCAVRLIIIWERCPIGVACIHYVNTDIGLLLRPGAVGDERKELSEFE